MSSSDDDSIWFTSCDDKQPTHHSIDIHELNIDDLTISANPVLHSDSQPQDTEISEFLHNQSTLSKLNLGMLWQWILCICTVNFDLDLGQLTEYIYPPLDFTESERKHIAFSSFPDSKSSDHGGDSSFTFRMKNTLCAKKLFLDQKSPALAFHNHVINYTTDLGLPLESDGHLYGYVFFRQRKDATIRRGYFQKSLVILSPHPWFGLFDNVLRILGPMFMDSLTSNHSDSSLPNYSKYIPLLEAACFNIASWPPPPNSLLEDCAMFGSSKLILPVLGTALHVLLPSFSQIPQFYEKKLDKIQRDGAKPILGSHMNIYNLFSKSLDQLWLLWELMIMGESILVIGDSPNSCGDTIWGLLELIKPIPFGGDFKPYFTIQDPDFRTICRKNTHPPAGTLLGVTNLVFSNVLEHWPNIIRSSRYYINNNQQNYSFDVINFTYAINLTTKHKPFLSKDKQLLKNLAIECGNGQSNEMLNNMIQRHFVELNDRFLQPLNRFFNSLLVGNPLQLNLSNLRSKPEIKPFNQDLFFKSIEQSIPSLPVSAKRPIIDLYRSFLKSVNFGTWLQLRTSEINREWRRAYINVLCEGKIKEWAENKISRAEDVECVDLVMRFQNELATYSSFFLFDKEYNTKYRLQPGIIILNECEEPSVNHISSERPVTPMSNRGSSEPSSPMDIIDIKPKKQASMLPKTAPTSPVHLSSFKTQSNTDLSTCIYSNQNISNPINVMGGLIPSESRYQKLLLQFQILLSCLPTDLKDTLLTKFKK